MLISNAVDVNNVQWTRVCEANIIKLYYVSIYKCIYIMYVFDNKCVHLLEPLDIVQTLFSVIFSETALRLSRAFTGPFTYSPSDHPSNHPSHYLIHHTQPQLRSPR